MVNKTPGFLVALLLFSHAYAQKSSLKGVVAGNDNKPLNLAPVMVLRAKDSVMVTYTRADAEGKFGFKNISDTANFILFFTYPQYVSFTYKVDMKNAKDGIMDVGKITMPLKAILLQEVLVKSQVSAIKIKGDTTEYDAGSFKVHPNATVEELLKQLPGLQVDQQGNITAQGQKVKKVLVDGEEFFSDDPTLVTRNFRADMIDKVQVYDKKSDAAAFTGIDDGVKDKTINLKIKEDKNHGLFGKIEGGGGPDYYNSQGMINFFKGKRKLSVFGSNSNVGQSGLGYGDRWKIGAVDEEQGFSFGGDDNSKKGLPNITTGGTHFDKKWNKDKSSINGNYNFSYSAIRGNESVNSQNNLPSGIILSNSNSQFNNSNSSHKLNGKFIQKLDTTLTFTAYVNSSFLNSRTHNSSVVENRRGDRTHLYDNQTSNDEEKVENKNNLKLSWEKKLGKKGRTLAFHTDDTFLKNTSNGKNISTSQFFDASSRPEKTAILNLQKNTDSHWNTLSFSTVYTEPLSKKLSLILNYTLSNEGGQDDQRSYAIDEKVAALNTAFSTFMNTLTWGYQGGAALNYSGEKLKLRVGNDVKAVKMNMESRYDALTLKKQFTNWRPSAEFRYMFNQYKAIIIHYNGTSVNPDRTQFIPFKYNNTQLTNYINNPNLTNSFSNSFSLNYWSSRVISGSFLYAFAHYSRLSNPIVMANNVSPSGIYSYQYVNMTGYTNTNYVFSSEYSIKIKFCDMRVNTGIGLEGSKTYSLINEAVNEMNNTNPNLSLGLSKYKEKKYRFEVRGNFRYTFNESSLQPAIKNNAFNYTLNPSARVDLFKKWEIHTDADYFWQGKTQAFGNNFHRLIWNAGIGRKLLKNDQLTISFSCHDLLNQNNGFSRTASTTFFSENRYTTIQRFFLISALWNFNKFYTPKQ